MLSHISDTARAVALFRALESERPDALFRDPYARRLAGARADRFLPLLRVFNPNDFGFSLRTVLLDGLVRRAVGEGADLVVNLAAGLDTRPYRMQDLPPTLRWVEVDLPGLLDEKEQALAGERPVCSLERIRLDLADPPRRRELFERLGRESRRALVLTEGLLMYLRDTQVADLARDLASQPAFGQWATDLLSPGVLRFLGAVFGRIMARGGATLHFGPVEGADFFAPYGWRPVEVRSIFREAARARRLNLPARLFTRLTESERPGALPWYALCLLERGGPAPTPAR